LSCPLLTHPGEAIEATTPARIVVCFPHLAKRKMKGFRSATLRWELDWMHRSMPLALVGRVFDPLSWQK
jgi:hypothetical protein